ncbi:galactokinase [Mycolicibacterium agri]|uniref:Galactokinase n=1 Tax=Mycolicibacterium agri TaxID=36811 RepID=A0A2A7N7Y8_MYCAG|nr:galactokinase [Mycolicibacterium agri]PEG39949.1 galactokinase [Mycolicibacterium agri]GFG51449.1 galactokinase [Mycolicibacterium agri]
MTVTYAAPGRINLIGEHTDYNLGFALPIALPERVVVTLRPDGSDTVVVDSADEPGEAVIPLTTAPGEVTGWGAYVAGVIWALREAGHPVGGGQMSITSDVAMGSGLASSAALECAVLGALTTAAGVTLDKVEQARIAQRAENEYVGAPTGLMDQLASLYGAERHALLMDCRSVDVREVPFDPDASGVALLLIDSRAPHRHAGGEYAARRRSCEQAAAALGVDTLRDAQDWGLGALDKVADRVDAQRARHIFTENRRVLNFVAALEANDYHEAGALFNASHASMRDDFEITTQQIDLIAESAVAAGALGARMTGGGFGGCVIALAPEDSLDAIMSSIPTAARAAGFDKPTLIRARAAAGAGPVPN